MSLLTVPNNITNSTLFRDWLNTINLGLAEERDLWEEVAKKAPMSHAAETVVHGIGNKTKYGHLKLTDEFNASLGVSNGTALTPKALYDVNSTLTQSIESVQNNLTTEISNAVSEIDNRITALEENISENYAEKNHASSTTDYGIGTELLYGHLKLTDARNGNLDTTDGTAATPKSVNDAYEDLVDIINSYNIQETFNSLQNSIDELESNTPPKYHASSETTYGVGTDVLYGHLKVAPDYYPTDYSGGTGNNTEKWIASDTWTNETSTDTAVTVNFLSEFYSDLKTVFTDLNTRINSVSNSMDNYALKNHASTENTYGLGTDSLYGHLKVTDVFDENATYALSDSTAVSANAFSDFLHNGINGETSYYSTIENLQSQINNINVDSGNNSSAIEDLQNEDKNIHNEMDALENRIEEIENLPISYDTYFFDSDLEIDDSMLNYSTFVCRNASSQVEVTLLSSIYNNHQFTIKNENEMLVKISPSTGNTIDNTTMPVYLGKNDCVKLKRDPTDENNANFIILNINATLSHSEYTNSNDTTISVSMSSKDANYFDINTPTCTLSIQTSTSNDSVSVEFSEKILVLHSVVNTEITYPSTLIWMNIKQKPQWGNANETLIIKLLQIGRTVYASVMHNSQLVKDLDEGVKYSG